MVLASQLRPGMVLKMGEDLLKVIESTYHVGQGKMPGSVHAKLRNVRKGALKELRWRPEEKLEDTQLEKQDMQFLYSDADSATFMNPTTFEQVSIPLEAIGTATNFLKPEMRVPVESYEGEPLSIIFPEIVEVKVETTAQPVHQQQDNTYKHATLENGLEALVPQFIKPGETVRIEVASGKYVDRVRTDAKRA
ncbi:MAG: translation elongation factor P [Acidobacteria bacterium]|nr:MAG: translation elongation factor P [Acidobacteriota bacterium]